MKTLKKKTKIILICVTAVILSAAIGVGGFFAGLEIAYQSAVNALTVAAFDPDAAFTGDRIHFLNTGGSDAILIESDGHFALVDGGEDTANPRGFSDLELKGYEQEVLDYIKARAGSDGKVTLDFILGTHAHSDHLGGLDTVVSDPDVTVNRAYLKQYNPDRISAYEKEKWDNQEVYDETVAALTAKNVPIVSEIPAETFQLGNLTIQFVNNENETALTNIGENDNAVGTIVWRGATKAFLAADMDNLNGDEDRWAAVIGAVDLLKLGHHGYTGSSSADFIRTLQPKIAVATNRSQAGVSADVKIRLKMQKSVILATGDLDGIIAEFTDGGFSVFKSIYGGVPRTD